MRRRWSDRSSRRVRTLVTQLARSRLIRESGRMRADIHDGPEQTLQSEAGYSNARPHQPGRRNLLHRTAGPYSRVNLHKAPSEHIESAIPPKLAVKTDVGDRQGWATSGHSAQTHRAHSGNPAFRSPSINSFAFDRPPRAMNSEIVKAGSVSSTRAAASRASASRPRWAKADARQQ